MLILIVSGTIAVTAIIAGVSYRHFRNRINGIVINTDNTQKIVSRKITTELNRIETLQANLKEARRNIANLDIPTPEALATYDNMDSSLGKLSRFYERHNIAIAGTEQFVLSLLSTSQTGEALQSLWSTLSPSLGKKIFGDMWVALKDGIHLESVPDFLERFVHGMGHISHAQIHSMALAFEHHNYLGGILTPLKAGAMEALGINDSISELSSSLHDVGTNLLDAAEHSTSIAELTDVTDVDIAGHIPVVTIALSSIREFQLLLGAKTNVLASFKNIFLDAVGTGVGAWGGAQAGASLGGCIFGPIGAVVGGVLGAVGGGVGGRTITNNIKKRPLEKAIKKYEENYVQMKDETERMSRSALDSIKSYADNKRSEFKKSKLLDEAPIFDTNDIVCKTALIVYQAILNELALMREGIQQIKGSIWYSKKRYDSIILEYENQLQLIERQLPSPQLARSNPQYVLNTVLTINMPNRKSDKNMEEVLLQCHKELKEMNDKNNSSVLMWSYMIKNLYQKTLNDIADFSNKQMTTLNALFEHWKETMHKLEEKVKKEKGRLGLE